MTRTLLLIDSRVRDIESIVSCLLPTVDYTVFDYLSETAESLRAKISHGYEVVSIVQHNYSMPTVQFVASMPPSVLSNVEQKDSLLASWTWFVSLMSWLKTERAVQTVDLLACNLWASADWRYVISKIHESTGIRIRASVNLTGAGGDFILESDNANLVGQYFTANIANYRYAFYYASNAIGGVVNNTNKPVTLDGSGGTMLNKRYQSFIGVSTDVSLNDIENVIRVYGNSNFSYAALTSSGRVYTYGNQTNGGNSSDVSNNLLDSVVKIVEGRQGFAALRSDGIVVSWGRANYESLSATAGNIISHRSVNLTNCVDVIAILEAFAALKSDGTVVVWGFVASWPSATSYLYNVVKLVGGIGNSGCEFFALRSDGIVIKWGRTGVTTSASLTSTFPVVNIYSIDTKCLLIRADQTVYEGFSDTSVYTIPNGLTILEVNTTPRNEYMIRFNDYSAFTDVSGSYNVLQGVSHFIANTEAYAYIQNGAVHTGGDGRYGGSFTNAYSEIQNGSASSGVIRLAASSMNMAALKSDGTVVEWGNRYSEGKSFEEVQSQLTNIVELIDLCTGYIAVKSDGTMISWGEIYSQNTTEFPTIRTTSPVAAGNTLTVFPTYYSAAFIEMPIQVSYSPTYYNTEDPFMLTYQTNVQCKIAREFRQYGLFWNGLQVSMFSPSQSTYTYTFANCSIRGTVDTNVSIVDITDISYNIATLALSINEILQLTAPDPPTLVCAVADKSTVHMQMTPPTNTGDGTLASYMYSIDNKATYQTVPSQKYALQVTCVSPSMIVTDNASTMLQLFVDGSGTQLYVNQRTDASNTHLSKVTYSNGAWGNVTDLSSQLPYAATQYVAINADQTVAIIASANGAVSDSIETMNWNTRAHLTNLTNGSELTAAAITRDNRRVVVIDGSSRILMSQWQEDAQQYSAFSTVYAGTASEAIVIAPDGQRIAFINGTDVRYAVWNGTAFVDGGSIKGTVLANPDSIQFNSDGNLLFCAEIKNGHIVVYVSAWNGNTYLPLSATSVSIATTGSRAGGLAIDDNKILYLCAYGSSNIYAVPYAVANAFTPAPHLFDITNLDTANYTVYVKTVNSSGNFSAPTSISVSVSVPPNPPAFLSVTRKCNALDVTFYQTNTRGSPVTNCYYSIDSVHYTAMNLTSGTYTITNLSSSIAYAVRLKSVNASGFSDYVEYTPPVFPYAKPYSPNVNNVTSMPSSVSVDVSQPGNNGNIIGYQYSTDGGVTYHNMVSTPIVISGLNPSTTYDNMKIRTVTDIGVSDPVNIPNFTTGTDSQLGAPTILTATAGDRSIRVSFAKGNESNSIVTGYKYSFDDVTYEWVPNNVSPFTINGLTNGTSYVVYMKTYTAYASSNRSNATSSVTPYGFPATPSILSLVAGNGSASIVINAANSNGSAVTKYQYSVAGAAFVDASGTATAWTIPNLTNGRSVAITVRAVNAAGPSAESSPVTVTPGTPIIPVITSVTPKAKALDVAFNTNLGNGFTVTRVYYSLNGGADVSMNLSGALTSPITITGLTNGTTYTVRLRFANANGISDYSAPSNGVLVCDVPSAVVINTTATTTQTRKAIVYFTPPATNGGDILRYQYAFDSPTNANPPKYNSVYLASPMQIDISNNVTYTLRLYAVNAAGTSPIGNAVTVYNKYDVPSKPAISTVTATKNTRTVLIGKPSSIGSSIKTFWYSLKDTSNNVTPYVDLGTTGTVTAGITLTIQNVPNNTSYGISIQAENDAGFSLASDYSSYLKFVYLAPSQIVGTFSLTASMGLIEVTMNTPYANGGIISAYKYKLNSSATVYTTSDFVENNTNLTTPRTVVRIRNGIVAGTTYRLQFIAVNELNAANSSLDAAWSGQTISILAK